MIGRILGWIVVGIVVLALGLCAYAPLVLSGRISRQEEKEERDREVAS